FEEVYKLWLEQYENTVRESTYQRVLTLFDTAILEHFKDIPVKKNHCAVLSKSYQ
ncbi:site-specific integrase, partial [Staphylococcus pseudintermedius]|nr:site-specific integrase [Staphylococcus pseudintermedius]